MEEAKSRVTKKFILFQLLAFGSFASMNYYNVYLKTIGFTSTQIGIWGSISSIIAMVTLPAWGIASDKAGSPKKLYLVSMASFATLFAIMPLLGGISSVSYLPLYALIVLYSVVKQPTHSLQDAWFVGTSRAYGINYASIRMWGSFGFAVISIMYGLITQYTGIGFSLYLAPVLVFPLVFLCSRFHDDEGVQPAVQPARQSTRMRPWVLFKNYYLVCTFIMTLVFSCYGAYIIPFFPYILEHAGVAADKMGLITGYGAFVQVVVMLVITRYCKKVPMQIILIVAGCFGVAETFFYGFSSNLGMLFVGSTFWGVSMATNVSILPMYIFSLVPRKYSATAISFNGTIAMLSTIIGNFVGGYLVASVGITVYTYCVAALMALCIMLFAASLFVGKHILKKTPEMMLAQEGE